MLRRIKDSATKPLPGRQYEALAENYLVQQGYQAVTRNFSSRSGEIDLIVRDATSVVFVEVRYRKNADYGSAIESVNRAKQQKLANTAATFLQKFPSYQKLDSRFDVIGIIGTSGDSRKPVIDWIKGAFYV